MATRRDCQGRGYGRRLLHSVLGQQLERGVDGSLLQSSVVGQRLYLRPGLHGGRALAALVTAAVGHGQRLSTGWAPRSPRPTWAGPPDAKPGEAGLGQEPALVELARRGEREAFDQLDAVGQHRLGKTVAGSTP